MVLDKKTLISFAGTIVRRVFTRACVRRALAATLSVSAGLYSYCAAAEAAADLQQAARQSAVAVSGESALEATYGQVILDLSSRDAAARRNANETLVKAGPKAVKALVSVVHAAQSRDAAIRTLTAIGPEAVTELIKLLQDAHMADKAGSALFSVIGPNSLNAAPALIECMQNNPAANGYCGSALVKVMSPKAKKHVPQLLLALKAPGKMARVYAAAALGEIGPGAKEAVQGLADALGDGEEAVRLAAAVALGKMGKKAKPAAQVLEQAAVDDASGEVRREAAEALRKVGGR